MQVCTGEALGHWLVSLQRYGVVARLFLSFFFSLLCFFSSRSFLCTEMTRLTPRPSSLFHFSNHPCSCLGEGCPAHTRLRVAVLVGQPLLAMCPVNDLTVALPRHCYRLGPGRAWWGAGSSMHQATGPVRPL
jgi:hypothetical protein